MTILWGIQLWLCSKLLCIFSLWLNLTWFTGGLQNKQVILIFSTFFPFYVNLIFFCSLFSSLKIYMLYYYCRGLYLSWYSAVSMPVFRLICNKKTRLPESASETISTKRQRLSAKLVPTFVTDLYDSILGFLDRSRYSFFQVAPQLYSRGRVDLVPDPILLRKSGSAGNLTRSSGSVARNSDH
jgi:hypothetical protein